MSDLDFSKKRQFFKQFIKVYESFPCLWNIHSNQYHDRELRGKAYNILVRKLQEYIPGADRTEVVKKINCFRSNLRKEKKKIQEGIKVGRVIKPRLWYHHHFDFLNGISRTENVETPAQVKVPNMEVVTPERTVVASATEIKQEVNQDDEQKSETQESWKPSLETNGAETRLLESNSSNVNTESIAESCATTSEVDKCDVYGINVAMKLRAIASKSDNQRIMAEMIINEALSMAEMGLLTLGHCKILKQF